MAEQRPVSMRLDHHPFSRRGSVDIAAVSAMHIIQAGLLLHSSSAGGATNLRSLQIVFSTLGSPGYGGRLVAASMISAAILALIGDLFQLGRIRLLIFMPQFFCLAVMAIGGLSAVWSGSYLDGTRMAWDHILTDQLVASTLFFIYWNAIIRRARESNG
jgi:hypothetical protein